MIDRLETPIDRFSGIPYHVSPHYIEEHPDRTGYPDDDDHLWHEDGEDFPRNAGERGLRGSRVQVLPYWVHMRKHDAFAGPRIPVDEDEQAWAMIGTAAGYVPEWAIVFDSLGRPDYVRLSQETREQMWATGQVRIDSPYHLREFLCGYMLNRELDIKESTIDEFLNTRDDAWRRRLGNGFLKLIARQAMEPLDYDYAAAYRAGLIYPPRHAQTASRFAARVLLHPEYQVRAHERLRERLVAA